MLFVCNLYTAVIIMQWLLSKIDMKGSLPFLFLHHHFFLSLLYFFLVLFFISCFSQFPSHLHQRSSLYKRDCTLLGAWMWLLISLQFYAALVVAICQPRLPFVLIVDCFICFFPTETKYKVIKGVSFLSLLIYARKKKMRRNWKYLMIFNFTYEVKKAKK